MNPTPVAFPSSDVVRARLPKINFPVFSEDPTDWSSVTHIEGLAPLYTMSLSCLIWKFFFF